jgi:site-specific recombinase XerD
MDISQISSLNTLLYPPLTDIPQYKPFEQLSQQEQSQFFKLAQQFIYSQEARKKMLCSIVNIQEEMNTFIASKNSNHTKNAVVAALRKFYDFCMKRNIQPALLTAKQADDFLTYLLTQGKTKGGKNEGLKISSCHTHRDYISSFYSFMLRRHPEMTTNPFKGSNSLPKAEKFVDTKIIPNEEDVTQLKKYLHGIEYAVLMALTGYGMRIGALNTIEIDKKQQKMHIKSKGKKQVLPIKKEFIEALQQSSLDSNTPFIKYSTRELTKILTAAEKDLLKKGIIKKVYSPHKFRHFYAIKRMKETGNIHKVAKELNHSNCLITESYYLRHEETFAIVPA